MRKRRYLGSLGVTPATDTEGSAIPSQLNVKATVTGIALIALAIGGLVYLTEKDR